MASVVNVSESDFESVVLNSKLPVLLDFWGAHCMPCLALGPVLDKLAEEYDGKVVIAKVNVAESPGLAGRYRVFSIPNLIAIKDGQVTGQVAGNYPDKIKELIEKVI